MVGSDKVGVEAGADAGATPKEEKKPPPNEKSGADAVGAGAAVEGLPNEKAAAEAADDAGAAPKGEEDPPNEKAGADAAGAGAAVEGLPNDRPAEAADDAGTAPKGEEDPLNEKAGLNAADLACNREARRAGMEATDPATAKDIPFVMAIRASISAFFAFALAASA